MLTACSRSQRQAVAALIEARARSSIAASSPISASEPAKRM